MQYFEQKLKLYKDIDSLISQLKEGQTFNAESWALQLTLNSGFAISTVIKRINLYVNSGELIKIDEIFYCKVSKDKIITKDQPISQQ